MRPVNRAEDMVTRCLLCDGGLPAPNMSLPVPLKEDPDAICPACRALTPDERRALREEAMTRLMRRAADGESTH